MLMIPDPPCRACRHLPVVPTGIPVLAALADVAAVGLEPTGVELADARERVVGAQSLAYLYAVEASGLESLAIDFPRQVEAGDVGMTAWWVRRTVALVRAATEKADELLPAPESPELAGVATLLGNELRPA